MPKLTVALRQKQMIDVLLLILCPLAILVSTAIGLLVNTSDLLHYYAWGTLLVELLVLYLPTRSLLVLRGGPETFGVHPISIPEWIYAVLLGTALYFVANSCNILLDLLYRTIGIENAFSSGVVPVPGGWRLAALLILVAAIPAYVEETLFRGLLLHAWLPQGSRRAILHSALLFALLHGTPTALPSILLVGIVLGYIAYKAGSCHASMGVHAGYQIMAVVLSYLAFEQSGQPAAAVTTGETILFALLYLAVGALLCVALSRRLLKRAHIRKDALAEYSDALRQEAALRERQEEEENPELKQIRSMLDDWCNQTDFNEGTPGRPPTLKLGRGVVIATYAILVGYNLYVVVRGLF